MNRMAHSDLMRRCSACGVMIPWRRYRPKCGLCHAERRPSEAQRRQLAIDEQQSENIQRLVAGFELAAKLLGMECCELICRAAELAERERAIRGDG